MNLVFHISEDDSEIESFRLNCPDKPNDNFKESKFRLFFSALKVTKTRNTKSTLVYHIRTARS